MVNLCALTILGERWEVKIADLKEDSWFEGNNADGKCSVYGRRITLVNSRTDTRIKRAEEEIPILMKSVLKHEVIHAFLSEAGLNQNAQSCFGPWAENEEMVEFFAWNWEKIDKNIDFALGHLQDWLDADECLETYEKGEDVPVCDSEGFRQYMRGRAVREDGSTQT